MFYIRLLGEFTVFINGDKDCISTCSDMPIYRMVCVFSKISEIRTLYNF